MRRIYSAIAKGTRDFCLWAAGLALVVWAMTTTIGVWIVMSLIVVLILAMMIARYYLD